jgi:carboxyl-terminal processing protease
MRRFALRPMTVIGMMAILAVIVGAQAPQPTTLDSEIARTVVRLVETEHLSQPRIDDETSKKWARLFLKHLDPFKGVFLQKDVDEFLAQDTTLDDQIKQGNVDFARLVFSRFLERNETRLAFVTELLKKAPDFTVEESFYDEPDKLAYAKDDNEANDRWRKRVKLEWLQLKVIDKASDEEIRNKLGVRYRDRNRIFKQFDMPDLLELYLSALTETFDPHSSYWSTKTVEDFKQQNLQLSLEGIGASLQTEDGYAVVKEIIPAAAADKDGRLQPEDKIVGIQKPDGSEIDLVEKKLSDVVRYIRGKAGTKVRLIVEKAGTKKREIYELTRQKVELKEQHAKAQVIESKTPEGKVVKIGVISLPTFYGDRRAAVPVSTTDDCRKLIKELKTKGVEAIVMDLRGNGGGLLDEAISLSGLFIDRGPVVQVKDADGINVYPDRSAGTAWDGALVVLIDHLSASASEIFAGMIKDYGRGLIVGDSSTFGKGTVQKIDELGDGQFFRVKDMGALKLTIQQFYRVDGESTQIRGVTPHIHIPSIFDHMSVGEGKMDNALKFDTVNPLPHEQFKLTPKELVAKLAALSIDRRKADPKFQKQEERIKKYIERKERHSISLQESKFRAEYVSEEDPDKAEEARNKEKKKNKYREHIVWESDYYNDEVIRIVTDYITIGSEVLAAAPVHAVDSR